ncbi:VCBS repeat-containing protein [Gemmata sp. JC717]|uniref:VCBS repeat-containing protein n=1 Tax=Gemmata algarum TaxID=2975278 RepID=UPI0021BB61BC|nr:VCBS repeat-containing protein [Gemmata algarum]MDY3556449.1 VCBS repeat-containing protein [Gemmata algarum]
MPATFTPNTFGGGTFEPFDNPALEVRSASGDVNADGVADIITAEGPGTGSGSRIRIYDGRAARFSSQAVLISDFYAYSNVPGAGQAPGFAGGVFVAAGDFNGDGFAEVVTSAGAGASGHVKVFDFNNNGSFAGNAPALRASFFAYPGFLGEIRVTTMTQTPGASPLLVTASGAGTTQSDIRMYSNAFGIGEVGPSTLVSPVSQTFPYPGYLGGVSIAGGSNGQLFVSPITGASQISTFTTDPFSFGGTTLVPGATYQTGFNNPTDVRLGSADINGDGLLDVLTSSVGANTATPISAFSLNNGLTALNGLNGFQGFGFFGNSWLGSSAFTAATRNPSTAVGLGGAGVTGGSLASQQGLVAPGATQGLQAGGPVFFNSGAFSPPSYTSNQTPVFFNSGASGANSSRPNNGTLSPGIF